MFKRLRDLASRAITHLRHSEPEEPLSRKDIDALRVKDKEPTGKYAKTYDFRNITNYLWIHAGLNRRERRTIEAMIRRGTATKVDKWMLRTTPKNTPRTYGRKSNNPFYAENLNG